VVRSIVCHLANWREDGTWGTAIAEEPHVSGTF